MSISTFARPNGSNNHEGDDDKKNLLGLSGNLVYFLTEPDGVRPYVVGGAGILGHQFDPADGDGETDWQATVNGGGGLAFALGRALGYVLANYTHGFDETTYVTLGGGVAFPLGGM